MRFPGKRLLPSGVPHTFEFKAWAGVSQLVLHPYGEFPALGLVATLGNLKADQVSTDGHECTDSFMRVHTKHCALNIVIGK